MFRKASWNARHIPRAAYRHMSKFCVSECGPAEWATLIFSSNILPASGGRVLGRSRKDNSVYKIAAVAPPSTVGKDIVVSGEMKLWVSFAWLLFLWLGHQDG
ncbi:hypothetical protein Tco_0823507 [Tanacetum coccineum]|uniref:Uncharacterized protein n=1 Tax=Tanacetum coccineum TaxID=301880 RepID=A0ABQ5AM89_9ASTR